MKNGYDQFFKNAREAAPKGPSVKFQKNTSSARKGPPLKLSINNEDLLEQELRNRVGVRLKKKKRSPFPWKMVVFSFVGLLLALWGFQNYEKVEHFVKNVEVDFLGEASAAEGKEASAKPAEKDSKEAKKDDKSVKADGKEAGKDQGALAEEEAKREVASENDPDHLQKLVDRKKELDAREEELNRVEQELQAQKLALEKRMKELEEMRAKISSTLEDRVKVDDQKIETLVQMYSQMKAPQAAKIFETLDEDLAVEVIGRMKKKNAADIMNLLKPEKAQLFSEKFAGYKRK